MYDPSAWRDYFVMVGGGSAALAGLVFVAMTLHLDDIVHHPVHRHRARTILTGFTAVFPSVPAGDYTIWRPEGGPKARVTVHGGQITEHRW